MGGGTALSLLIGHRTSIDIDLFSLNSFAIVGNGTRVKDFIDIAFLSSFLSLDEMLHAYETKYKTKNGLIVLKSLDFYQDINHLEPIRLFMGNYS